MSIRVYCQKCGDSIELIPIRRGFMVQQLINTHTIESVLYYMGGHYRFNCFNCDYVNTITLANLKRLGDENEL